jgi:transposase
MKQFYENLLGLDENWKVAGVEQDNEAQRVTVRIAYAADKYRCPECGLAAVMHDTQKRTVRHLDTCEYQTYLEVRFPRVECARCGTKAVIPPFAAASSRFTKAFESRVIELCQKTPVQKVANDLGLHWHAVAGIIDRSYQRGRVKQKRQSKNEKMKVRRLGMDEKSWRGHDYVTVLTDTDRGCVLDVLDGRDAETVTNWFETQQLYDFSELRSVSMDMAKPYIKAVRDTFANADELMCFDRFHVAQLFTRAVDAVRRRESAAFDRRTGINPLVKTRFEWLRNSERTDNRAGRRRKFMPLTGTALDTAKAWRLKERAGMMWHYAREGTAEKAWKHLLWQLSHSRIAELKKLFKTIKTHLRGILNAIKLRANNALAEARNSCIQRIRYAACGYRNKARFRRDILFQFGGLDLAF